MQVPRKRHKREEIIAKLRQVDVLTSQGQSVADAVLKQYADRSKELFDRLSSLRCWMRIIR